MRRLLPCVARCSLLPFCVGCCSVLPLCVAWSSALAARLVASRWSSAAAPLSAAALSRCPQPAASCSVVSPGQQQLSHHGAPASNKPHSAEKSTPVWLALWRIWAGFANSQLRCANFPALIYVYASIPVTATFEPLLRHSKSFDPSAPIAYATSVSPPNEAAAWPGAQVFDAR